MVLLGFLARGKTANIGNRKPEKDSQGLLSAGELSRGETARRLDGGWKMPVGLQPALRRGEEGPPAGLWVLGSCLDLFPEPRIQAHMGGVDSPGFLLPKSLKILHGFCVEVQRSPRQAPLNKHHFLSMPHGSSLPTHRGGCVFCCRYCCPPPTPQDCWF